MTKLDRFTKAVQKTFPWTTEEIKLAIRAYDNQDDKELTKHYNSHIIDVWDVWSEAESQKDAVVTKSFKEVAVNFMCSSWNGGMDAECIFDRLVTMGNSEESLGLLRWEPFESLSTEDFVFYLESLARDAQLAAEGVKNTEKTVLIVTIEESGDMAVIVDNEVVGTADPDFEKISPMKDLANNMAKALGVQVKEIKIHAPSNYDWNWSDVIELLP